MAVLTIDADLAQQLEDLAARENLSINDLLRKLLDKYYPNAQIPDLDAEAAFLAMDGMFDNDIIDLSSMTKEDVMEAYRKKFEDTD